MKQTFCVLPIMIIICVFGLVSCNRQHVQQIETSGVDQTETETTSTTSLATISVADDLIYDSILYYEFAEEVGYYWCMYVTYDCATVWQSVTPPNREDPTASDGFDTAYTENIDPALYLQAVELVVSDGYVEKWDEAWNIYKGCTGEIVAQIYEEKKATLSRYEWHLVVYDEQNLVRWGAWLNDCPFNVTRAMKAIKSSLQLNGGEYDVSASSQVVGILQIGMGTIYGRYHALYRTAQQITTWDSYEYPPNFDSPLDSAAPINVQTYDVNGLIDVSYIDRLPIITHTPQEYAVDGGSYLILVVYYADGTRRVVVREPCRDEWHPVWIHLTEQLYSTVLE